MALLAHPSLSLVACPPIPAWHHITWPYNCRQLLTFITDGLQLNIPLLFNPFWPAITLDRQFVGAVWPQDIYMYRWPVSSCSRSIYYLSYSLTPSLSRFLSNGYKLGHTRYSTEQAGNLFCLCSFFFFSLYTA